MAGKVCIDVAIATNESPVFLLSASLSHGYFG